MADFDVESSCGPSIHEDKEDEEEEEEKERSDSADDSEDSDCEAEDDAGSAETSDCDGHPVADDASVNSHNAGSGGSGNEGSFVDSAEVAGFATSAVSDEAPESSRKNAEGATDPGIIYLSRIPQYMGVKKVRQIFSQYCEIGRIFLQPDTRQSKKKKSRLFTEGWVEFADKRIAKRVALSLNNTMVGGKRRSIWYEELWNLKYLKGFKWTHLNERLAYEKAVHQQRMRTEIALAKKEATFYAEGVQKLQMMKKAEKRKKDSSTSVLPKKEWSFKQRKTEEMRQKKTAQKALDKSYLRSIFS